MNLSKNEQTILIVDDEPKNIQVVGTTLAAFQYDFMVADSGEQAMKRISARLPDLVLLDIQMPGMDGFEVCQTFKKMPGMAEVPVIFLSANNDKNYIVRALEAGGVDYVTKPFNKAELLARVRTHLELKRIRDERVELLLKTERFLEIMAHDLKNWIGSASLSAQMLPGLLDKPEKAAKLIDVVVDSTGRSLDFIAEYLASARESRLEEDLIPESVSISQLCREAIAQHDSAAYRKQITLVLEEPGEEVEKVTDSTSVRRILANLLSNAIKFSPPESTVTVSLTDHPVKIVIADQGPGFNEEDLEHVFEAYTRLSARPTAGEASIGLGLSIVKQLCDRLGASISVETLDPGASVSLEFPRREGSMPSV